MKNLIKRLAVVGLISALAGCVQYSLVTAGSAVAAKGITVTPSMDWNKSPANLGKKAEVWTHDGESLDQLIFIGGISEGEALFNSQNKALPMPTFNPTMLPNDVEDLVKTSLKNLAGGELQIDTSNLKPAQFGDAFGFEFELDYFEKSGLKKRGNAFVAIKNEQLYMILFTAADLHYFGEHLPEVRKLFESAVI